MWVGLDGDSLVGVILADVLVNLCRLQGVAVLKTTNNNSRVFSVPEAAQIPSP